MTASIKKSLYFQQLRTIANSDGGASAGAGTCACKKPCGVSAYPPKARHPAVKKSG